MAFKHNPTSVILGELPLKTVFKHCLSDRSSSKITHNGKEFSATRMATFALHGCKCDFCGLEGTKIILSEDAGKGLHLDLFAEVDGRYVLMNRDHILPASKGGKNTVWNMRSLCQPCNTKRGNKFTSEDKALVEYRVRLKMFYERLRRRNIFSAKWNYRIAMFLAKL